MNAPSLQLSRRTLLTAAAAVGGGLLIGFPVRARAQAPAKAPVPSAFIRIGTDGKVTFLVPYVEMGQGAYTSQMQILAEELEVDPATVTVVPAPPRRAALCQPAARRADHRRLGSRCAAPGSRCAPPAPRRG